MSGHIRTAVLTVLVVVIAVGGTWLFHNLRHNALLNSSEQFSLSVAENIITTWDQDYFVEVSDDTLLASFDKGGINAIFNNFKRVGSLESLGEASGELFNFTWLPAEEALTARVYIDAAFSTGPSQVYVELIERDDTWKVLNFYLISPMLIE